MSKETLTAKERERINRIIHEWMGKCVHENKFKSTVQDMDTGVALLETCSDCGEVTKKPGTPLIRPNYTADLNLIAEVEVKVIEEFGLLNYREFVCDAMSEIEGFSDMAEVIIATAEQKSTAIAALIEGESDGG